MTLTNFDLNLFLEIINGSWAILTLYFLVFLCIYLHMASQYFILTWKDWFVSLPLGMGVALSLFVNSLGSFITRATLWIWRYLTDGKIPFRHLDIAMLCIGSLIAATGLLFMIRMYTKSFFGEWPWIGAAGLTSAFIVWSLVWR